jgi:hypothetical protein
MVLMADESAISSIASPGSNGIDYAYIWALDVNYDPEINDYPAGYEGVFRVHPSALLQDLYVALAAKAMTPVELWGLLQRETGAGKENGEGIEDEDGEEWMHGEL